MLLCSLRSDCLPTASFRQRQKLEQWYGSTYRGRPDDPPAGAVPSHGQGDSLDDEVLDQRTEVSR